MKTKVTKKEIVMKAVNNEINSMEKRLYVVKINRPNQHPYELFQSEDLKESFDYFNSLNVEDLVELEEYELVPYYEGMITDWFEDELKLINCPLNEWVIKSK